MPIERPVTLYPIPAVNWDPGMSIPYRVKGSNDNKSPKRDTWISIAREQHMDVKKLIWFNFQTENPDEVNWYLRRNVGCNVATPDGRNWMFSDSASPGIIYLPLDRIDMEPTVVTGKRSTSPLALEFEGPSSPLDTIGKIFDGFTLLEMGLAIAGIGVGEVVMLGIGIVIAPMAPFVVMGGMHEAALNELRKQQMLDGLSRGIVLAAAGRSNKYIETHGWVQKWPVRNTQYPQYGTELRNIYNTSLVAGIGLGRDFSEVAKQQLWKWLGRQLADQVRAEYSQPTKTWTAQKWYNWYRLCAATLQRKIRLN